MLLKGKNYGKDIRKMAAHIIRRFRHLSEKQRMVNRIIVSSNCWAGINDLRPKFKAISVRNNLRHKKPDCNRTFSNDKK